MTSRSRLVAKAFGSAGVLAKATQAVPEEVGGGVEPVANEAALGSGNAGDLKFATATKSAFLYDGNEWDRIQTGSNAAPFFKVSPVNVNLGDQESASVSVLAGDPEGFPITYSWDALKVDSSATVHYKEGSGTYPPGVTNIIHSPASSGTFRFQSDSAGSQNKGTYTYRILANDGAITSVASAELKVAYTNLFQLKYKAAIEAAGGTCVIHNLNATDHADLHTYIDASVGAIADDRYDVLFLQPGSYNLTAQSISYSWDPFRNKAFAIVGNTNKPHDVLVSVSGSSGRDYPIFGNDNTPTGFKAAKALANLTFKRLNSSGSSYSAAMRRFMGGLARNVLFDFNNLGLSLNYYNSEPASIVRRFTGFAVTIANVGTRGGSYSGQNAGVYFGRSLAENLTGYSAYTWTNNSSTATLTADGTEYWTYTDNGDTYGHLYKAGDVNYTIDVGGVNKGFSDVDTG